MEMPFEDESFDSVISNGSLHEWETPVRVFNEIYRCSVPADGTVSPISEGT